MEVEKIREFIENNLTVLDEEVSFGDEDNIFELGLVDSPFAIQLVLFIEEEFGIEMDEDAALAIQTVGDAVRFITNVCREQGVQIEQ